MRKSISTWIILLITFFLGCSVNLKISTKNSQKWCKEACEKYVQFDNYINPNPIDLIKNYYSTKDTLVLTPYCVCMSDCINDNQWCNTIEKVVTP